ncbi:hypothetical protein HIM_09072 [Hirsutella minnesotensis 3608]|uniref:Rhodanese domain-containing protein n=1 Tax=Hirsutella minnesotensis 3608 TaxID=1043627 RepID=A0A0F8A3B4_9HYPO|nr:hypothetical protein HIM_09072 [Hirsutella minnesotensis 3608]
MAASNPYNVFRGPDSLAQFYDPDQNPPLPLVEIPERLNPMRKHGVRIYAKLLTSLPAQNVKSLPVLNMLQQQDPQVFKHKPLAEASSGSTAISLGIVARALLGHEDVHAHVSNKKPISQMKLLRLFGIHVDLFGGMTQPTYDDPKGIMTRLRNRAAQRGDVVNLGQYHNHDNWKAHVRWTGPQIVTQLPEINVFCATVGTGGTLGRLADARTGETSCVFVCADLPYQYVDMYHAKLGEDEFPKIYNQELLTCDSDVYDDRFHLTPPHLVNLLDRGDIISSLFCQSGISGCCSSLQQYAPPPKSPESNSASSCPGSTSSSSSSSSLSSLSAHLSTPCSLSGCSLGPMPTVIDFRSEAEFRQSHLQRSINLPLPDRSDDLFASPGEVHQRWTELTELFEEQKCFHPSWPNATDGKILLVCTHGDTSRMATAMLRARGRDAYCVKGGFQTFISSFDGGNSNI